MGDRRVLRGAACLAAVLAVSACVPLSHAEDADAVDVARIEELRTDPWLAPDRSDVARYIFGSNMQYGPGTATVDRTLAGSATQALLAELDAAAGLGWEPTYARCAAEGDEGSGVGLPDEHDPAAVVVHLRRPLADGALAAAEVEVTADEAPGVARVLIGASVPHHLQTKRVDLAVVDPTSLVCLGPAARATTPALVLGDPAPLNVPGQQ